MEKNMGKILGEECKKKFNIFNLIIHFSTLNSTGCKYICYKALCKKYLYKKIHLIKHFL